MKATGQAVDFECLNENGDIVIAVEVKGRCRRRQANQRSFSDCVHKRAKHLRRRFFRPGACGSGTRRRRNPHALPEKGGRASGCLEHTAESSASLDALTREDVARDELGPAGGIPLFWRKRNHASHNGYAPHSTFQRFRLSSFKPKATAVTRRSKWKCTTANASTWARANRAKTAKPRAPEKIQRRLAPMLGLSLNQLSRSSNIPRNYELE